MLQTKELRTFQVILHFALKINLVVGHDTAIVVLIHTN